MQRALPREFGVGAGANTRSATARISSERVGLLLAADSTIEAASCQSSRGAGISLTLILASRKKVPAHRHRAEAHRRTAIMGFKRRPKQG